MNLAELRARAQRWIADDPDSVTRAELHALLAHPDPASTDLADRFAGHLEFGTAGLRGILGAGPNRMNRAVVARTTWGLAHELLESVPNAAERGVIVGRDARRMSNELAEDVAAILAGAGLRVVLFPDPVPTPLIGFTVKRVGAAAGVVVTASHNPPEYNGYKVYWENAAQIVPPVDARIAAAIERAPSARVVARPPLQALRDRGLVTDASVEAVDAYVHAVRALAVHPDAGDRSLRIVYTPLHGVGDALVRRVLAESRFSAVASVPEQQKPDGAFPTVTFPNPEEPGAMARAFAFAKSSDADLVLANDPDADRLAVAVRVRGGGEGGNEFRQLTGNELGVLLGHYLLTERRSTKPRVVLASIVSSPLLGRIASDLGVRYEETLTGFKWIANRAIVLGREGFEFVFGYEEALGYCIGDVVYDKDGVSAALLAAEVTAVLRERGQTPFDALEAISRRWGLYASTQLGVTRKGVRGMVAIRSMMAQLRSRPPEALGGDAVVAASDYEVGLRRDLRTGSRSSLTLPKSNVVTLDLASGARVIARPSGTEPKVKFYIDVKEDVSPEEPVAAAASRAEGVMKGLADAFVRFAVDVGGLGSGDDG